VGWTREKRSLFMWALCMPMKRNISLVVILFAFIAMFIGLKAMEFPPTSIQVGFLALLIAPYLYIAVLTFITANRVTLKVIMVISLVLGCLGTWTFIDALYINIDAQGGLVLFFVPMMQLILLAVATLPIYISRKSVKA
jgi:hypothetical protein